MCRLHDSILSLSTCLNYFFYSEFTSFQGIMYSPDDDICTEVSETDCQSWSTSQTIPSCVGFHLKRISVNKYELTEWELAMVKYFLRNALVLEELIVICITSMPLADRILLNATLQKLPRGSMTCSIKVQWCSNCLPSIAACVGTSLTPDFPVNFQLSHRKIVQP